MKHALGSLYAALDLIDDGIAGVDLAGCRCCI
jgi:hypothetical protein